MPDNDAPRIDVDAFLAASRAEAGVKPVLVLNGVERELPAKLPLELLVEVAGLLSGSFSALRRVLEALFPKEEPTSYFDSPNAEDGAPGAYVVDELWRTLDADSTRALVEAIGNAYGVTLGNSEASSAS